MSPVLLNIYLNDVSYDEMNCNTANHSDDNHLYKANSWANNQKNVLENGITAAIGGLENYRHPW